MKVSFGASANAYFKGLESQLTGYIKEDAVKADWPLEAINAISISVNGLAITVDYDENYASIIEDLEYGTEESAPRPILRNFLDKHSDAIEGELVDLALGFLVDNDTLL